MNRDLRTTDRAARGLSSILLAAALATACSAEPDGTDGDASPAAAAPSTTAPVTTAPTETTSAAPSFSTVKVKPTQLDVGGAGWAMALADQSLWVQVDPPVDAISVLDTGTGRARPTVPAGHVARFGAEGLWVIGEDWLAQIDPRTGKKVHEVPLGGDFALGAGGVWVYNGDGLHRVDPADGSVAEPIATDAPRHCVDPAGVLVAFRSAWVACKEGRVVRMDLAGERKSVVIRTAPGSHTLTATEDAVWVTNYQSSTVSRIDPATGKVTTVPEAGDGGGITVGGGSVWTSTSDGIVEIDPEKAIVVRKLDVGPGYGGNLYELVWDHGTLWASTQSSTVLGIRPPA